MVPSWPLLVGLAALARALAEPTALLRDPDTYLHIAVGQWVLLHHDLPLQDSFSHSLPGAAWVPHEWLAEAVLAAVYGFADWSGVVLLTIFCFAAALALLMRMLLRNLEPLMALILTIASGALLMPHLLARPHILALPLLVIWTGVLFGARDRGDPLPLWLLPLLALWANLHGSFMFGLALAGFLAAEAAIWPTVPGGRRAEIRRWSCFLSLALLAGLATPNHIYGYLQPIRLLAMPALQASFSEWQSPTIGLLLPLELWVLGALLVGLSCGLKLPPARLLLVLGLFHLTFQHVRHADLLAAVAPLAVAAALGPQIFALMRPENPSPSVRTASRVGGAAGDAVALAVALMMGITLMLRPLTPPDGESAPGAALAAARAAGLSGPVFNAEVFGGYLVFNRIPTFIDGRIEMYGDGFLSRYLEAARGKETVLVGLLDQYQIAWTLLAPEDRATDVLDRLPGWRRLYSDKLAVIHVRVDNSAG